MAHAAKLSERRQLHDRSTAKVLLKIQTFIVDQITSLFNSIIFKYAEATIKIILWLFCILFPSMLQLYAHNNT